MNTDISICSRALIMLGEKPISSFDERRSTAQICANIYPGLKATILSAHPWRFAMQKKKLSRETTAPINEWKYSHIIPPESLSGGVHAVFNDETYSMAVNEFEIFGRRVYSNYEEIWCDYKANVDESQWPEHFANLMVYALAADIAFAVVDQQNVADSMAIKAYGNPSENGVGGAMGMALALQAQGQGNIGIRNDAFTSARNSDGGMGLGFDQFRNS